MRENSRWGIQLTLAGKFGNSVVMPVIQEVARIMVPHIQALIAG